MPRHLSTACRGTSVPHAEAPQYRMPRHLSTACRGTSVPHAEAPQYRMPRHLSTACRGTSVPHAEAPQYRMLRHLSTTGCWLAYSSAYLLLGNSLRKKLRNGGRWLMHWTTEFMKQVLPRLTNPVYPLAHTGPGSFKCVRTSLSSSLGVEPFFSICPLELFLGVPAGVEPLWAGPRQ